MSRWPDRLSHAVRHPWSLMPGAPRGVISHARDWVDQWVRACPVDARRGPRAAWWEIEPAGMLNLPPPHSVNGFAGRPPLRIMPMPAATLYFLKGARILGRDGVVISPDNRVFAEFTYVDAGTVHDHTVFRRRRFPRPQPLAGWYATLNYPSADAYYHWMVESLPRLRLIEPHLDALNGVFVPSDMPGSMHESLLAFGLRAEQIIPMNMGSHFAPEHLLVPGYCAGLDIPAWVAAYCRRKTAAEAHSPQRRLYVSRAGARRRRALNEDALARIAADAGFEVVKPETLSFAQQAALFAQARVVVGPSGAALANALFCAPGGHLAVLQPHAGMAPHVFYSLACAAGLQYWDIVGQPSLAPGEAPHDHCDFTIDAQHFSRTLALIEEQLREPRPVAPDARTAPCEATPP